MTESVIYNMRIKKKIPTDAVRKRRINYCGKTNEKQQQKNPNERKEEPHF